MRRKTVIVIAIVLAIGFVVGLTSCTRIIKDPDRLSIPQML